MMLLTSVLYTSRMWNGEEEEENMYEYSSSMANLHVLGLRTELNKSKTLGGNFVKMSKMTKLKGMNFFII